MIIMLLDLIPLHTDEFGKIMLDFMANLFVTYNNIIKLNWR